MAQYYFVLNSLPQLVLGEPLHVSFREFVDRLTLNLSERDFALFRGFLEWIDLRNAKALWMGLPFDDRGFFSQKELEEALLTAEGLSEEWVLFLTNYETVHERLAKFPFLEVSFLHRERKGILGRFFSLERKIRLILLALRAKRMKRDLVRELEFEDPSDPLVHQILSQKDAPEYNPPFGYEGLADLFHFHVKKPGSLERAVLRYRIEALEEMEQEGQFGIDQIVGYGIRLYLMENWNQLDQDLGMKELEKYG